MKEKMTDTEHGNVEKPDDAKNAGMDTPQTEA
jgi:hypothetical protein